MARKGQARIKYSPEAQQLAEEILRAYPMGVFPMSETRHDTGYSWYRPHMRGVMPLDGFHTSKSLMRFAKQNRAILQFSYDERFFDVMEACANRNETWISFVIRDAFLLLHERGLTHSAEVYHHGELIGGVYGLALGGAFFGESMFSNQTHGSKLALGAMIGDLNWRGFELYDTQFLTDHLASLGGQEITDAQYQQRLNAALAKSCKPIERGRFDGLRFLLNSSHQQD